MYAIKYVNLNYHTNTIIGLMSLVYYESTVTSASIPFTTSIGLIPTMGKYHLIESLGNYPVS